METQQIGLYLCQALIGEGGMGAVYRGIDPRFGRDVAIKVLHSQFQRDPQVVARFKAEAVIQAKLSHPNIITVYDFVATDQVLAMVMEYVDGTPLDALIERAHGPLPVALALSVMSQVLSAIGFAHARQLVHRDLKPSNILVQDRGEGQVLVKVVDFGIAKILGSEKVRTATSAQMGTLAYMSPEHLRSPKSVDHRSDLYALGITLFEMLSGRVPFDSDSEYGLMQEIIQHEVPRVSAFNPAVPPALEQVIARATAKRPEERFQSAADFSAALRGQQPLADPPAAPKAWTASPQGPTVAERRAPPEKTSPPAGPRWALVAAAATALLAVLAVWALVQSKSDLDGQQARAVREQAAPTGAATEREPQQSAAAAALSAAPPEAQKAIAVAAQPEAPPTAETPPPAPAPAEHPAVEAVRAYYADCARKDTSAALSHWLRLSDRLRQALTDAIASSELYQVESATLVSSTADAAIVHVVVLVKSVGSQAQRWDLDVDLVSSDGWKLTRMRTNS